MTRRIDWGPIEHAYRTTQQSARQLSKLFGVNHTAVSNRARAYGWQRQVDGKLPGKLTDSGKLTAEIIPPTHGQRTDDWWQSVLDAVHLLAETLGDERTDLLEGIASEFQREQLLKAGEFLIEMATSGLCADD
jgi:hypothetical protein